MDPAERYWQLKETAGGCLVYVVLMAALLVALLLAEKYLGLRFF